MLTGLLRLLLLLLLLRAHGYRLYGLQALTAPGKLDRGLVRARQEASSSRWMLSAGRLDACVTAQQPAQKAAQPGMTLVQRCKRLEPSLSGRLKLICGRSDRLLDSWPAWLAQLAARMLLLAGM